MYILNVADPLTLLLITLAVALLIFLGQEVKKCQIVAIPLFAFLFLLIMHVAQLTTLTTEYAAYAITLSWCIVVDFVFVFICFFGYLWVDDIEAKAFNKKSIDNSLDWFWKNV